MKIDLDNYEAFFLDYHEGTLSPGQVAELMLFVEQHPHLKAELESFEPISLNDFEDDTTFSGKDKLKKDPVTAANFEEMAVAFVEGTLPAGLQKDLLLFIEKNPSFKTQFELFRKTILPLEKISFEGKEALKKQSSKVVLPADLQLTEAEFLFISSVEGTLTAAQKQQLDLLLKQERYKKEFALYAAVKLPAERIIFEDKASLKRKPGARVPFYYYVAAAASVVLLLGFWFLSGKGTSPKPGLDFSFNRGSQFHDVSPVPKNNGDNSSTDSYANSNDQKKSNIAPVLVKNDDRQKKKNEEQPVKKEEKNIIANQPVPDSVKGDVIAKNNNDGPGSNIELVNTFADSEDFQQEKPDPTEYLTLRQAVSYKVKNALLKDEMRDKDSYREDKKKFTWYDALLVVVKGVRNLTGRDVEVKKRYDSNNELIAYQFQAGKFSYTRPVSKN